MSAPLVIWLLVESTVTMPLSSQGGVVEHMMPSFHTPRWTERSSSALIAPTLLSSSLSPPLRVPYSFSAYHPDPFSVGSKSICLAACLAFVLYCIETVCVTQIMRVDLCGISQLLQFLTIKWDIPAGSFHRGSFTVPRRENS